MLISNGFSRFKAAEGSSLVVKLRSSKPTSWVQFPPSLYFLFVISFINKISHQLNFVYYYYFFLFLKRKNEHTYNKNKLKSRIKANRNDLAVYFITEYLSEFYTYYCFYYYYLFKLKQSSFFFFSFKNHKIFQKMNTTYTSNIFTKTQHTPSSIKTYGAFLLLFLSAALYIAFFFFLAEYIPCNKILFV